MKNDLELSRILTNIVSLVEGVGDVYPSGNLAQTVTLTAINVIAGDDTDDAKVAVSTDATGRRAITATIGVADGYTAKAVLRDVADVLRAYVQTTNPASPPPVVDVKVSRIETETVPA